LGVFLSFRLGYEAAVPMPLDPDLQKFAFLIDQNAIVQDCGAKEM
jgi:hypothetical protein